SAQVKFRLSNVILVLVALAVVLALSLSAMAATKLTVVVVDLPSALRDESVALFTQLETEFEQENPDIDVELVTPGWAADSDSLVTDYVAGTMPGVFQMGHDHHGVLHAAGALHPLNDFVDEWGQWSDFPPGVQEDVTFFDTIYGIPYNASVK